MTRPYEKNHHKIKYVRAARKSGLLGQRGAQTELARILGVSKQYVGYLLRVIEAEGSAEELSKQGSKHGS